MIAPYLSRFLPDSSTEYSSPCYSQGSVACACRCCCELFQGRKTKDDRKDKVTSCQRQLRPFLRAVYRKTAQACSVRCSIGHPILNFRSGLEVVLITHCRCRRCRADWLEERLTSPNFAQEKFCVSLNLCSRLCKPRLFCVEPDVWRLLLWSVLVAAAGHACGSCGPALQSGASKQEHRRRRKTISQPESLDFTASPRHLDTGCALLLKSCRVTDTSNKACVTY